MPTMGLRRAFAVRKTTPDTATAEELFAIACHFGVGFSTLVNHLAYGVNDLDHARVAALLRLAPKTLRAQILGGTSAHPLVVVDEYWEAKTVDIEVGTLVLMPHDIAVDNRSLAFERDLPTGRLFRALRPGISSASRPKTPWAAFVRVSREQYVGLARFRHLEEPTE